MTAELYELEGWLSDAEGDRLAGLAAEVTPGRVIVEVGSYRGKSSCFLASGSERGHRVPVYCVDLWTMGGQWESDVERRAGGPLHHDDPAHHEAFRSVTASYDVIVEVRGHSHEIGAKWTRDPIGLLFIDGDHSYDGVRGDLEAWVPHVVAGGWVACHDYRNGDYPGVRDAVDEYFFGWGRDRVFTESMLSVQL